MLNIIYFKLKSLRNIIFKSFLSLPFQYLLIFFFYLAAVAVVYLSIWGGLKFIIGLGALGSIIIKRLIFLMFFILFFMISVSFSVIYYTSSFRSRETSFLLTLPHFYKDISFLKFLEKPLILIITNDFSSRSRYLTTVVLCKSSLFPNSLIDTSLPI